MKDKYWKMNMHVSNYDVNNYRVKISIEKLLNVVVVVVVVDHYDKGKSFVFFFENGIKFSYFVSNKVIFGSFFRNVKINIIVCSIRIKQSEQISIICKVDNGLRGGYDERKYVERDESI
jgi:hypothetical protein